MYYFEMSKKILLKLRFVRLILAGAKSPDLPAVPSGNQLLFSPQ
jgi:hypothetical protein